MKRILFGDAMNPECKKGTVVTFVSICEGSIGASTRPHAHLMQVYGQGDSPVVHRNESILKKV